MFALIGISLLLQLFAALLALRLIPITGKWPAWTCIAAALVLMSIRRSISLFRIFSGDDIQVDLPAEWVALAISVLMLVGIGGLRSVFLSRAETTKRLRESDERLRLMLKQLPIVLWAADVDLRFTCSLGSGLAALGLKPDQVVGMTLWEYFQTQDPTFRPMAASQAALGGTGDAFDLEFQGRIFESHVEPFRDETDKIVGTIGVAHDVTARKVAEQALQRAHDTLEHRVEERTAELQAANKQLVAEQIALRRLYEFLERERKIISYEIHDGLVQCVTGAKMKCETLSDSQATEPVREELATIAELLHRAILEGRNLVNGLRPTSLDDFGLIAGINELVQGLNTGLAVTFSHDGDFEGLAPVMENSLYRIVQESLTNAAKYSRGKKAEVRLEMRGEKVFVEINDDGAGFDPTSLPAGHYGLRGIQERARILGGSALIDSDPSKGTRITVELPLLEAA